MKKLMLLAAGIGFCIISCKKEPNYDPTDNNADSIITTDSMVSGTYEASPDSLDSTLPVDSSDYDVDSIKNIK